MSQVGILTDSTAQFPTPFFTGRDLVTVLPMQIKLNGHIYTDGDDISIDDLPSTVSEGLNPRVLHPTSESFRMILDHMVCRYQSIIILLLSSKLSPASRYAHQAVASLHTSARIQIIDTGTTAAGLGFLVQEAAKAATKGLSSFDITYMLRGLISHTYTIFCIQGLTYLSQWGQLDPAQALVGELIELTPILLLENGQLRSTQKARSSRNIVDIFHEFATEIDHLQHIALFRGTTTFFSEANCLRERIRADFPHTPYCEHTLGVTLGTLLGPRSLGLVAVEDPPKETKGVTSKVLP